jgi:uncharacterized phiE125 gp8 family phage protein
VYVDNLADAALGAGIPAHEHDVGPGAPIADSSPRGSTSRHFTRRALLEQTWTWTLDCFPARGELLVPRPNLLSVTTVKYYDTGGVQQTMSTDDYSVDVATLPGRVLLNYGVSWPITRSQYNAVEVVLQGWLWRRHGGIVPEAIKSAMKLVIADMYKNREPMNIGNIVNDLPAVSRLLWSERFLEAS